MKLFLDKFKFAFRGLAIALKDSGVRIQLILMFLTIIFFSFFSLTKMEWIIVIFCCGFVISAEVVNCIVEKTMDFIHPECSEHVRNIKDLSAGMVLVVCIFSLVVGLIILGGKLL